MMTAITQSNTTGTERVSYTENNRAIWRRRIYDVIITIVLMTFTLVVIVPFIWMLMMSFRTTGQILENPYGLPESLRLDNYKRLM
ncbi:MAG: hypothetical protein GYB66_12340, partial [Chloroflexi bacterium]|nr:hypothetical protein [Chloroflexota bacterium]